MENVSQLHVHLDLPYRDYYTNTEQPLGGPATYIIIIRLGPMDNAG